MTYIYYASKNSQKGKILHQLLHSGFKKSWMKRCKTLPELTTSLHEPIADVCAAILLITDRNELDAILALNDILLDIKLIIIFSGETDISQAEVIPLRPSFMSRTTDIDFAHVMEVLKNIVKNEINWRRSIGC